MTPSTKARQWFRRWCENTVGMTAPQFSEDEFFEKLYAIDFAVLQQENERLKEQWDWVVKKLGLSADASLQEVYGRMHVWDANQHGYKTYIEAFKCDDKQGEIARLTVQLAEHRTVLRELAEETGEAMRWIDLGQTHGHEAWLRVRAALARVEVLK